MKCMCAQTRPRFILSSERGFLGNGVWTHVNSKGKIPSTGKFPQRRIEPATLWTASPNTTNELFRIPLCGFESGFRLESRRFRTWNFLKLVVTGFLRVLQFPPFLHRLMVQPIKYSSNKCEFELSLRTVTFKCYYTHATFHTKCSTRVGRIYNTKQDIHCRQKVKEHLLISHAY